MNKLPKVNSPIQTIHLPVLGKSVRYKGFTVKEEKILLMANESTDDADRFGAFKQVTNNCIVDEDIDASTLSVFDLEVLFLLIRSVSVGDELQFSVFNKDDEQYYKVSVNISDVVKNACDNVKIPNKVIPITSEIGVTMKPITLDIFEKQTTEEISVEQAFDLLIDLIDSIYDEENVYDTKDYDRKDLQEFVDGFTADGLVRLQNYINNYPRLTYTIQYKNSQGEDCEYQLEGMRDFFQYA